MDFQNLADRVEVCLEGLVRIGEAAVGTRYMELRGELLVPEKEAPARIKARLKPLGLTVLMERENGGIVLRILSAMGYPRSSRPALHLALLLLTFLSTLIAGVCWEFAQTPGQGFFFPYGAIFRSLLRHPGLLLKGLPFSVTLMLILGVHEMGHFLASRAHRVRASLPFFIPAPPPIPFGTLGAVIKTRSLIPDRKALLDIGAAGPIAGFLAALAAAVIGLRLSSVLPPHPPRQGELLLGFPVIFSWLFHWILGPVEPGNWVNLRLHPIAFAALIGFFVTCLNLIPAGQLDGGHIVYAMFGKKHVRVAKVSIGLLLGFGFLGMTGAVHAWPGWFLWGFLILFLGIRHAPPMDDITQLSPLRALIAVLCFGILVLCFTAVPFDVFQLHY